MAKVKYIDDYVNFDDSIEIKNNIIVGGTVNGRDINLLGSTQDTHISNSSGIHGVTGNVIGTTDIQTLTNKTITDSTNIIRASELAISGGSVLLSSLTSPSVGQVLTADSSSSAIWQSSGDIYGPVSSLDKEIPIFSGTTGKILTGSGIRHYGPSATDPTTPVPQAGDKYYNTVINHEMCYDSSRSKWLSVATLTEGCGNTNVVRNDNFYSRYDGMVMTTNRGPYVPKGTIVRIGYTSNSAINHTFEVLVDGILVSSLNSGGSASATNNLLNDDFLEGTMSMKNSSNSDNVQFLQAVIYYKLRI